MIKKLERVYVTAGFKKILKVEAAKQGLSLAQYTRELEAKTDPLNRLVTGLKKQNKKRGMFDFP